jgi:ribose-phosphate pyrophosphokinase
MLHAPLAIIAKRRPEPNKVDIVEIIGDVSGMRCIMVDDMIDTAGSIISGAEALVKRGATEVSAACTHGVFSGGALNRLEDSVVKQVISLDTIPIHDRHSYSKLVVLPSAPLIGEAIRRIYLNESVSGLFDDWR